MVTGESHLEYAGDRTTVWIRTQCFLVYAKIVMGKPNQILCPQFGLLLNMQYLTILQPEYEI